MHVTCVAGITLCALHASPASHRSHHACHAHCVCHASCQQGRQSGKISALEILAPQKNKHPRKCNLFLARKVLEIFKYSDHFSDTEYAGNSLYILNIFHFRNLWNSLTIPGIFPQYSAFECFLLFTVYLNKVTEAWHLC